jgi:hypothetical protein
MSKEVRVSWGEMATGRSSCCEHELEPMAFQK